MKLERFRPTLEMLRLVGELDEFKGAWRSLSNISPERLAALKHVATIESIGSSTRIEGAALSDEQVEALLSGIQKKSFRSRDEQEVAGYADVMDTVFKNWQHIPLTENHIKQLHRDLLKYSSKDDRHRGNYKTSPNNVEAFGPNGESLGVVFKTATPFDTPYKMTELISWTNEVLASSAVHPLLVTAAVVAMFLAIHPFQDGNGRLSRVLTTLLLLKNGYAYVP
jgi:Fic family protein